MKKLKIDKIKYRKHLMVLKMTSLILLASVQLILTVLFGCLFTVDFLGLSIAYGVCMLLGTLVLTHAGRKIYKLYQSMPEDEDIFDQYDKRGVRAFVKHSASTGKWGVEAWRKKTVEESKGSTDWEMKWEGHVGTYYTRKEAELYAIKFAEQICQQYKF